MPMNPVALSSNAPTPYQSAPLSTPVWGMGFMTGLGVLVGVAAGVALGLGVVVGLGDGLRFAKLERWLIAAFRGLAMALRRAAT